MTQWLSHELAQGLAFNAGSNFDPPKEVRGRFFQPDVSLGVGRMPLNKTNFPDLTVQELRNYGGENLFPNYVNFPNLALHLRCGLPWRGDMYLRFANATTPPGYKISPTMTAAVQTNSYGAGVRRHFLGEDELPTVTVGGHYNHVRGRTTLSGKFNVNVDNSFRADSDLNGQLNWNLNSFGLTAVVHKSFGAWTPFGGLGYNYATGSTRARLELKSQTVLIPDIVGEGSERPEQSQGRWIFGAQYARPTWSFFGNAELKALGQLQYRSFVVQFGFALPYEIGRGPAIIYKKRRPGADSARGRDAGEDARPAPARRPARQAPAPAEPEPAPSSPARGDSGGLIFLR